MAQLEKQVQEHIMESEVELKLLNTKMATQKEELLSKNEQDLYKEVRYRVWGLEQGLLNRNS